MKVKLLTEIVPQLRILTLRDQRVLLDADLPGFMALKPAC